MDSVIQPGLENILFPFQGDDKKVDLAKPKREFILRGLVYTWDYKHEQTFKGLEGTTPYTGQLTKTIFN